MFRRSSLLFVRRFSSKPPKKPANLPKIPQENEVRPKAYAPSIPNIEINPSSSNVPYVPKEKHQRVSFEYPEEGNTEREAKSAGIRWRSMLPVGVLVVGGAWAMYTLSYFTDDTPTEFLSTDRFTPFIITNRVDVDKDHYLIELTPKFNRWKKEAKEITKIWNGNKLWSVEIKQPQIMVVRKYTPLPLEIYKSEETGDPIVRLQDYEEDSMTDGKLVFYIKKYDQGEVARWIYKKPLGSELELRGPFTDFEFPKTLNHKFERPQLQNLPSLVKSDPAFPLKPDNLVFFAAGTGIAPVLQTLLSKNPYQGFIDVYYSRKSESEVPVVNFMYFLEKLDRVKFHHLVQEGGQQLVLENVPSPVKSQMRLKTEQEQLAKEQHQKLVEAKLKELKEGNVQEGNVQQTPFKPNSDPPKDVETVKKFKTALEQAQFTKTQPKLGYSLALVCGPDGYVTYVAGVKPYDGQGAVGGLLKEKGWTADNVFKL